MGGWKSGRILRISSHQAALPLAAGSLSAEPGGGYNLVSTGWSSTSQGGVKIFLPRVQTKLSKTARFCPGCGRPIEKVWRRKSAAGRYLALDRNPGNACGYVERGGPVEVKGSILFGLSRIRPEDIRASAEQGVWETSFRSWRRRVFIPTA